MGIHAISSSNYIAGVDSEACAGCETCEERCPMEAIAVKDDGVAQVNEALCIGCGVCIPTCDTEAVGLVQRGETNPPPDLEKFITVRYKAEEGV